MTTLLRTEEEEFEDTLDQLRERFKAFLARWRASGWKRSWLEGNKPFTELEELIIDAADRHFNRGPFTDQEMAEYLEKTGWPHRGGKGDTPERTINSYCNGGKGGIGSLIERVGPARFRFVPPKATGYDTNERTDLLMKAEATEREAECGCRLFRHPNNSISFRYCFKHQDAYYAQSKKGPIDDR